MQVFLIRHAAAQPLGQKNDFTDEKRTLTSEGRDRMKEAAKGLRKLGAYFDFILTSPLARAVETAEIVAAATGYDRKSIEVTPELAPGGSIDDLLAQIKSKSEVESIALVGHEPDLGELTSRLVGAGESNVIELRKGSVSCVNLTETVPVPRGKLIWLLTLKQLRMLGKS